MTKTDLLETTIFTFILILPTFIGMRRGWVGRDKTDEKVYKFISETTGEKCEVKVKEKKTY